MKQLPTPRSAITTLLCAVALMSLGGCGPAPEQSQPQSTAMPNTAPVAAKKPHELTTHGHTRVDNYYWLRDDTRTNETVLTYLRDENAYAEAAMAHTRDLQDALYDELKARVKEEDESVPVKLGEYWYSTRYTKGAEHETYLRRTAPDAEPEVILDVNQLASPYEFYNVRGTTVSPDGRFLAYSEDTVGRDERVIRFKDLQSGEILEETIPMTSGDMEWANDNETLLYVKLQEETLIPFQVWRHTLGTAYGYTLIRRARQYLLARHGEVTG